MILHSGVVRFDSMSLNFDEDVDQVEQGLAVVVKPIANCPGPNDKIQAVIDNGVCRRIVELLMNNQQVVETFMTTTNYQFFLSRVWFLRLSEQSATLSLATISKLR